MNRLDLDISKYSDNELRDIFNIGSGLNNDETRSQIDNYRSTIAMDSNLSLNEKDNIAKFLDNVSIKLCGSLDTMFIGGPSSSSQTFSAEQNNMVLNTGPNHPIIQNPNALAGREAKIYEGKTANHNQYPPGYINPINVKTIKKVLNVDTKFRSSYYSTLSSDVHFDLPETFTRVVNLRLTSFEIPLSVYAVNSYNSCFTIDNSNIDISYGNYTTPFTAQIYTDPSTNIVTMMNNAISEHPVADVSYAIDPVSGKSKFTTGAENHTIFFNRDCSGNPDLDTPLPLKLGWLLGFRAGSYDLPAGGSITSEGIATVVAPKYIYICINDFTNAGNNNFVAAFSESTLSPYIIARVQYQDLVQKMGIFNFGVDDDTLHAAREYFGPVDIQKLHLQLLDDFGRVLNLNNMDWSCTITFDILYD